MELVQFYRNPSLIFFPSESILKKLKSSPGISYVSKKANCYSKRINAIITMFLFVTCVVFTVYILRFLNVVFVLLLSA